MQSKQAGQAGRDIEQFYENDDISFDSPHPSRNGLETRGIEPVPLHEREVTAPFQNFTLW